MTTKHGVGTLVLVLLITGWIGGDVIVVEADSHTEIPEENFEFESYREVLELFEQLEYTPEVWQAGIREVPRIYLTRIPERWRDKTSKEITTLNKKRLFFRALAPLVLRANELILKERVRLDSLRKKTTARAELSGDETSWLLDLAQRYGVDPSDSNTLPPADINELWTRVDIIPTSLALSQAAEESGWGTSRFASQGNALFGQWTWGEHAMKPANQRKELGNYGLAAFESPLQSVLGYMHNLNTHNAYKTLRQKRAEARESGDRPEGKTLAETMINYSERGEEYVKSLHTIMRVNHLNAVDSACLAGDRLIYLVPVGSGVEADK
jgi:uncharacterized FlgJ-related protein